MRLKFGQSDNEKIRDPLKLLTFQVVTKEEVVDIDQLQPGDHISYRRRLGYKHHAIVIKVDKENMTYDLSHVIGNALQFSQFKLSKSGTGAGVTETEGISFSSSSSCCCSCKEKMYRYEHPDALAPEDVIENARAMLAEEPTKYHVLKNNCEHYAYYCKTGKSESWQAHKAQMKFRLFKAELRPFTLCCCEPDEEIDAIWFEPNFVSNDSTVQKT